MVGKDLGTENLDRWHENINPKGGDARDEIREQAAEGGGQGKG